MYFPSGSWLTSHSYSCAKLTVFITVHVLFPSLVTAESQQKTSSVSKLEQLECLRSEITSAAPWLPILWFTSDPKWKQDKVKVTNLKKLPNIQILKFCKKTLHATHLLKLLDVQIWSGSNKNCKRYRADTECGQTDGRTNGRIEWNQYTPYNFVVWRYNKIPLKLPKHLSTADYPYSRFQKETEHRTMEHFYCHGEVFLHHLNTKPPDLGQNAHPSIKGCPLNDPGPGGHLNIKIESDKTTSIYNVSTRVLSKK